MANKQGRLIKELDAVKKDDSSGIKATPVTVGDLRHLKGSIAGPPGTVYEGGLFEIDITIPANYPFEPPKMKYITKIWHPNISSQTGAICLVRDTMTTVSCFYELGERITTATIGSDANGVTCQPHPASDSHMTSSFVYFYFCRTY
jgi:ubiquitin-protein ligase